MFFLTRTACDGRGDLSTVVMKNSSCNLCGTKDRLIRKTCSPAAKDAKALDSQKEWTVCDLLSLLTPMKIAAQEIVQSIVAVAEIVLKTFLDGGMHPTALVLCLQAKSVHSHNNV